MVGWCALLTAARTSGVEDEEWRDRIVALEDAIGDVYYAQLVDEEWTVSVRAALRRDIECNLIYSTGEATSGNSRGALMKSSDNAWWIIRARLNSHAV